MILEDIVGKRVLVTAGGRGIGEVIVRRFAEAGAKVHTSRVRKDEIEEWKAQHPGVGITFADVGVREDVDTLFDEALADLGGLDILVNNAGVSGQDRYLEDLDYDDWRRTLDVNLTGAMLCSQKAIRVLKEQSVGGSIVHISSNVGLHGLARRAPYVASKWAMIGLTRTMSLELGPFGIRVNAICPGDVEGDRINRVITMEAESRGVPRGQVVAERVAGTALKSFISPDDVASLVLFICSEAGAKIAGQALAVDAHCEAL